MSARAIQWPVWIGVLAGLVVLGAVVLGVTSLVGDRAIVADSEPPPPTPAPEAVQVGRPSDEVRESAGPAASPPTTDPSSTRRNEAATAPPPVAAPPPAPVDPEVEARLLQLQQQVRDSVATEFEKSRAAIVSKCFTGQPATGGPSTGVTFSVVVDETGREIARGTSESRDETPHEVRTCLRQNAPPPVKVAPPGQTISVDVFVSYP